MVKVKEVTLWVGGVDKKTPQVRFIRTNKTTKGRSHPCFFFPPLESMNCAELCTKPDWFAVLQNSAKIKAYWEQCGGWKFLINIQLLTVSI